MSARGASRTTKSSSPTSAPSSTRSKRGVATVAAIGDTSGLRAAAEEKRVRKRRDVEAAIAEMQKSGEVITFKTVAERAGVSREYLYQNFRDVVDNLRTTTQFKTVEVDGEEIRARTVRRSATIEAALRNKVASLEKESTELRKKNTILERRYEKALGEAEEWRCRYNQAVSELLDLKSRVRKFE